VSVRRPSHVARWLTDAERAGLLRVTPRNILAVERLLRTQPRWSPDELASRLASLLAEDGEGWQRIYRHCRDTLEFRAPGLRVVVWRALRRRIPGWVWAAGATLLVAGLAVAVPWALTALRGDATTDPDAPKPSPPQPSPPGPPPVPDPVQHTAGFEPPRPVARVEQVEPERRVPLASKISTVDIPADQRLAPGWLALWIALSAGLAGLAARWWRFSVADFQRVVEAAAVASEEQQDDLMRQVEHVRSIYFIPPVLPLQRGDIDEAATLLARMTSGEPGRELDVPPTMRRTIDAGGRFSPVYAPSPASETLLILVDTETHEGHAFLDGVVQLLAAWAHGGLRFERYDFRGSPEKLSTGKHDVTLDHLIQRHEDAPLLLFSRLLDAREFDLDRAWMPRLRAWPRRVWIDLDPRGADLPERRALIDEAERAGLVHLPFTRDGLLAAARGLAQDSLRGGAPDATELPPAVELREALELWAACAACVPDPTWPQLEAVRQQLAPLAERLPDPRLLARLLEWLHRCGWLEPDAERGQGERLLLSESGVEQLLVRLRKYDDARPMAERLEPMTRRLLIEQLLAADVAGDPYSAARQQLKLRYHQALLDERAVEALLELADGPVADELRRMLTVECRLQAQQSSPRWHHVALSRAAALAADAPHTDLRALVPSTWSGAHFGVFVAAAALALVSWAGVWSLGALVPQRRETTPQTYVEPERSRVTLDPPLRPDLVAIRGGKFLMGSTEAEKDWAIAEAVRSGMPQKDAVSLYSDEARHQVEVHDFDLCRTEVTQGQWKRVTDDPLFIASECGGEACDDDKPITGVTWFEAIEYLNRLTELENQRRSADEQLTACYVKLSHTVVSWDHNCTGYRLPTEAEWEYAARAGSDTTFFFGDDPTKICDHGNVMDLAARRQNPRQVAIECDDGAVNLAKVGSYKPNKWGLYDVHGNVKEWTWDWYADYESSVSQDLGGPESGTYRVLRGGSFTGNPWALRSSARFWHEHNSWRKDEGLRCARGPRY